MRIVSAGDLRVHAPVSDDPIGLLANAFNFTLGRFNRFVLHTQTTIEQLDTLSRQQGKHIEGFKFALDSQVQTPQTTGPLSSPSIQATPRASGPLAGAHSAARSDSKHGKGLTSVDTMLEVLDSSSMRISDTGPTLSSNAHETVLYSQEFTNFARSFLQEMYALTQKLIDINQEMRTSVTSFRLDSASEVQWNGNGR